MTSSPMTSTSGLRKCLRAPIAAIVRSRAGSPRPRGNAASSELPDFLPSNDTQRLPVHGLGPPIDFSSSRVITPRHRSICLVSSILLTWRGRRPSSSPSCFEHARSHRADLRVDQEESLVRPVISRLHDRCADLREYPVLFSTPNSGGRRKLTPCRLVCIRTIRAHRQRGT